MPEEPLLSRGSNEASVPMWAFESRWSAHDGLHASAVHTLEDVRDAIQRLDRLHWDDHDAVHQSEGKALTKALDQATVALAAALEAHRREHEIEKVALDKADAAHQQRHEQMNEIRSQLNDQASTFVNREVLDSMINNLTREITANREQRQHDIIAITKDLQSLRESTSRDVATVTLMLKDLLPRTEAAAMTDAANLQRAAQSQAIADLQLSRSREVGGRLSLGEHNENFRAWVAIAVSLSVAVIAIIGFLLSHYKG